MTGPRHLLVIASQCSTMGKPLADLEPAAHALDAVLRDPDVGGCAPGLPDGRSLAVLRAGQDNGWIYAAVRKAIEHAAACQATLVLALLGHGFIAGDDPTLYFMAPDSAEDVRDSAVNVGELLVEACDRQGVAGVLAVVDTCNAAGAAIGLDRLAVGARRGRSPLALLMASAVGQASRRLRLSRELAALLSAGSPDAGSALFVADVAGPIRARGQTVVTRTQASDQGGDARLWLAVNRRTAGSEGSAVVGPLGAARLTALLRAVDPDAEVPERWDEQRLRALLKSEPATAPTGGASDWDPARIHLRQLADDLSVALLTARFLRGWLGSALTTDDLRAAVAQLRPGPAGSLVRIPPAAFERVESVVEHMALNKPVCGYRTWVCRLVVALAEQAGQDLGAPEPRGWAERIDAGQFFNDARRQARRRAARRHLRLVVSLHASVAGDWPASLSGWLLDGGQTLRHEVFPNRPEPDKAGTEEALAEAVLWAEDLIEGLGQGAELQRIEVAAPSALLLRWRPEEYSPSMRLGMDYDVVLRWSVRLNPPKPLRMAARGVRNRWERIGSPGPSAPVDWLSRHEAGDPQLWARLRDEHYAHAVGLDHVPEPGLPMSAPDLLDLLLTFSPVVLWPDGQDGFPSRCQLVFNDYWHTLPTGLIDARRRRWRDTPADDPGDVVARLRGVWDDEEWLDFCAARRRARPSRDGSQR